MAISFSCSSSTKLAWMLALLLFLATMLPGHGQSASGFVSIDCGLTSGSYNDITTKIMYHSDRGFVEGGLSYKISTDFMANATNQQQKTLRSFPDGPRNCYTLPSTEGETFQLRAAFTYGNYDGLNKTHDGSQFLFGLHIGVNFWETVNLTNWDPSTMVWKELLSVAPSDFVSVCLVNLGSGTPFVSVLELRPLKDSIYSFVSTSVSASYIKRIRFGDVAEYITRYPVDPYDGFWESWSWSYPWLSLNTSNKVFNSGINVPSAILQKASTVDTNYSFINITVEVNQNLEAKNLQLMFLFHFAEIDGNNPNRTFDIYSAGKLLTKSFSPTRFQLSTIFDSTPAWRNAGVSFSLNKTPSSRLPPLINAFEVYSPVRMDNLTTDVEDVKYMKEVKKHYNLTRTHWNGDPCSPREYSWEGLTCDYSKSNKSNQNPRIVRVDLSTSGLKGELAISFTNMVSLENLDLSHNNLTGVIPEFQLMSLKVLNLENNQLDGPIPDSILQRYHAGLLDLRLEGNPICSKVKDRYCSNKKKNIPHILLVKVIVPMVLVSLVVVMCISWKSCWKGKSGDHKDYAMYEDETPLHVDVRRYTYAELKLITNDFHSIIGKGGFGIVYHGILENGDEVAVKVLVETSIAESTDFLHEVQTLSKVHHKNLVILQGYCQNKKCLALIYDFMPRGNLQQLLRGEHDYRLDWEQRLHIALDAAQGLEYLHESCSPSIVHRDVKTPNILLNKNLEGIISDFGLSRAFNDAHTHISTVIAGTLGYLDPEYHATFQLTVKTDVYSFGIVLLELVTGRPPVFMDPQAVHLPNWVRQKMAEGSVRDVVDMRLSDDQHDDRSLNNAVDLAMNCLENAAIHRPTMTEVVSRLKACLPTVFRETQYISVASRRHKNDMDTEIPFNNDQGGAGGMSEIGLFSGR